MTYLFLASVPASASSAPSKPRTTALRPLGHGASRGCSRRRTRGRGLSRRDQRSRARQLRRSLRAPAGTCGAGERVGARNHIRAIFAHGVDVDEDAGVVLLVHARKAVRSGRLRRCSARDVDLCTLHVQLCSLVGAGGVQRDHLGAQEILAVRQAGGDRDRLLTCVVDDLGCAPDAVGVSIVLNFEPSRQLVILWNERSLR